MCSLQDVEAIIQIVHMKQFCCSCTYSDTTNFSSVAKKVGGTLYQRLLSFDWCRKRCVLCVPLTKSFNRKAVSKQECLLTKFSHKPIAWMPIIIPQEGALGDKGQTQIKSAFKHNDFEFASLSRTYPLFSLSTHWLTVCEPGGYLPCMSFTRKPTSRRRSIGNVQALPLCGVPQWIQLQWVTLRALRLPRASVPKKDGQRGNINYTIKKFMAAWAAKTEAAVLKKKDSNTASAPAIKKRPTMAKRRKGKRQSLFLLSPTGIKSRSCPGDSTLLKFQQLTSYQQSFRSLDSYCAKSASRSPQSAIIKSLSSMRSRKTLHFASSRSLARPP